MIERISEMVWGPFLLIIVLGAGIWLTLRTKFYPVTKIGRIIKDLFKNGSGFGAMATALGATVGTGNIVGVASAIAVGGAGTVFWMWAGAFFGMMLKFAEASLSVKYRNENCGGAPVYIEKVFGGKTVAKFWSLCCVLASFGTGCMIQANSAATASKKAFGISPVIAGIALSVLTAAVLFFGAKAVTKTSSFLVPVMAAIYIIGCVLLILRFWNRVPLAFGTIFNNAFKPLSLGGGIVGILTSDAVRVGISRGTFTNEAGMGSASLAHSESSEKSPAVQGSFGIAEVFLDTIAVCTLTALVILITDTAQFGDDAAITAFSLSFGRTGTAFLGVSMNLFALAAMIGWAFYGEKALNYVTNCKIMTVIYRLLFCFAAVIGSVAELPVLWNITDIFNGIMIYPNIAAILFLSKEVEGFAKR